MRLQCIINYVSNIIKIGIIVMSKICIYIINIGIKEIGSYIVFRIIVRFVLGMYQLEIYFFQNIEKKFLDKIIGLIYLGVV